jgi:hypothetical protein
MEKHLTKLNHHPTIFQLFTTKEVWMRDNGRRNTQRFVVLKERLFGRGLASGKLII